MKKFSLAMVLLISLGAGCCCTSGNQRPAKTLFNGRDLAGWVVLSGGEWTVENGVLVGRNGKDWSTNPEKSGSWLRTEKDHGRRQFRKNGCLESQYERKEPVHLRGPICQFS